MKECKRGFPPGAIAIAIAIAFAICAMPPIAPDASAERFDDRFPASPWALKPDADVAVTNQFAVLSNELAGIAAMLGKDGEQCHETLSRLPEECRPGFVRSLYADFLKKGPESPFGFGRSGDQPGAVIRNRRKWMRLHSDEDVAAGRLRNRMARAAFISSLQSSGRPFPETVQLGMFLASCSVWIDSGIMEDPKAPDRRREEDGIPSAEALLEWFAENEMSCESVRAKAKARLENLKKTAERGIGKVPNAAPAADGKEQAFRSVPDGATPEDSNDPPLKPTRPSINAGEVHLRTVRHPAIVRDVSSLEQHRSRDKTNGSVIAGRCRCDSAGRRRRAASTSCRRLGTACRNGARHSGPIVPRRFWPEDPLSAAPTRRAKSRSWLFRCPGAGFRL